MDASFRPPNLETLPKVGRADSRFPPGAVGEALPISQAHAADCGFCGVIAPNAEARRKPPLKGEVSALADGGVGQHTPLKRLLKGYFSL